MPIDLEGWKYGGNELKDDVRRVYQDKIDKMKASWGDDSLFSEDLLKKKFDTWMSFADKINVTIETDPEVERAPSCEN